MVKSPSGQQLPYQQMPPPVLSNLQFCPCQNQGANVKIAQSSPKLALPHSGECEGHQVDERPSERMRKWQSCDNDTQSTEDNKRRQREHDQNHRKKKTL